MEAKRLGKISQDQKQVMVEFLKCHKQLSEGKFTSEFTNKMAQNQWLELTDILNCMPEGQKDWKHWRKAWQDFRAKTKAKNSVITKHITGTGGGEPSKDFLTEMEEDAVNLIGVTAIHGLSNTKESTISITIGESDNSGDQYVDEELIQTSPLHLSSNKSNSEKSAQIPMIIDESTHARPNCSELHEPTVPNSIKSGPNYTKPASVATAKPAWLDKLQNGSKQKGRRRESAKRIDNSLFANEQLVALSSEKNKTK